MWNDRTSDAVARIRFPAMCGLILWAFWGLMQVADAGSDSSRTISTAADPAAVALLAELTWDEDAAACPNPAK